jgi:hypothetical protein
MLKFQVSVTRTRGRKEWKRVYLDHLCIECKNVNFGIIIMDTNGGCNTRYIIKIILPRFILKHCLSFPAISWSLSIWIVSYHELRYRGIDNPSTSLVPVCLKCFDEVSVVPLKDRSKVSSVINQYSHSSHLFNWLMCERRFTNLTSIKACLMKSKVRISDFARNSLLNKIPYNTRDKKRKPETRVGAKNRSQDFNCPDENDDLALKQCRRALR